MAYFSSLFLVLVIYEIVVAYKDEDVTLPELLPKNCGEAIPPWDQTTVGIFDVEVQGHKLKVFCIQDPDRGPAWSLIQRRMNGAINFNRTWYDYESGFGSLHGTFWLALKYIHILTNDTRNELWIKLDDFGRSTRSAKYNNFTISDAKHKYTMSLGNYSGNAGDSLKSHNGKPFSTIDKDNDESAGNCAKHSGGGWWFTKCFDGFLNGIYGQYQNRPNSSITWRTWMNKYKYVHMAIRPFYYSLEREEL